MYNINTNIKVGDIVLVRGAAKRSKIIAKVTRGHFSHACLIVNEGVAIEAVGCGVIYSSLVRFAFKDLANVRIMRPKFNDENRADEVRNNIIQIGKGHQSKRYDIIGAILSVFKTENPPSDSKFFCSQLVASILSEAGFALFDGKDHHIKPNDIFNCDLLEDVTDLCVNPLPEFIKKRISKRKYELSFLDDGGSTESEMSKLFRLLVDDLSPAFKKYGLDPPVSVYKIIDAITDPINSRVAPYIDGEAARLFDKLKINKTLKKSRGKISDDIDDLKEEIKEYGEEFIRQEHGYTLREMRRMESRLKEISDYEKMYNIVWVNMRSQYARRMKKYYSVNKKVVDEIQGTHSIRLELLNQYME